MRTKRSSWRQWAITGLSGRSLTSGSCMLFWIKKTQTWLKSMVNRLWCLSRTWVPAVRCAGTPARARVTPVGCWTDARCLKETMIRSTLCSSVAQFLAKGCGKLPCATGNVAVAEGEFSIMLKGEKKVPCLYSLCVKMSPFIPGDKETSRGRAVGFTGQVRAPPPPQSAAEQTDGAGAPRLPAFWPLWSVWSRAHRASSDCLGRSWQRLAPGRGLCPLHRIGLPCCSVGAGQLGECCVQDKSQVCGFIFCTHLLGHSTFFSY